MLSPVLLDLLRQWWKVRSRRHDRDKPAAERWLFPGRSLNAPMTTRQLNRLFHEAVDAAGIKAGVTLHTLRRHPPARAQDRYSSDPGVAWTRQVGHDRTLHGRRDGHDLEHHQPARRTRPDEEAWQAPAAACR
jgi:hypothetical protein